MYQYKDLKTLTKVAAVTLLIYMVVRLLLVAATIWAAQMEPGAEGRAGAFGLVAILAVLLVVTLISNVVIVGMWIYRASANAHTLSDEMTISPGWAVGWYFIPIALLFKPYQAMREIWMASHFRGNWHGEPNPPILAAWWGLWIVVNIIDNVSYRLGDRDANGAPMSGAMLFDAVAAGLNVALCLVLINMMRQIARAQSTAPYEETFA